MKIKFNRLDLSYQKHKEEYDSAVERVLESGWYILGKEVRRFEEDFAKFIGVNYCVALNSGLDALILGLRSLGIGTGDEVIVPANTYIATIIGISENGAIPVLVEPDEFYNIDTSLIEMKISNKTKAILPVHLYGQAANMDKITQLAKQYNLIVVEDCAQSHGARFRELVTGSYGDIGCFSFYPTKNIGAFGDSGAIVTNSFEIYQEMLKLRNYGSFVKYENEIVGLNSRMDEIQAALLCVKLNHYDEMSNERRKIAKKYLDGITNSKITLPKIRTDAEHVWHLFVIRVAERSKFQDHLSQHGIEYAIHYPIPPHLSKAYSELNYKIGDFLVTEKYAKEVISLPFYEGLSDEEVEYVIKVINKF